jgi:uncharacterized membrane protein YkvA (DUF1232 family)
MKQEVSALALAVGDRRTPWYARLLAVVIVAYALSPLDLIPDPIPILGYLDDLILIPAGIALVLRLIPTQVMADARARAAAGERVGRRWLVWAGASIVVVLWVVTLGVAVYAAYRVLQ